MNGKARDPVVDASLEGILRHLGVHGSEVLSTSRTPSPFATLFPAEVVRVQLQSGETRSVFVKRLGSEQADHPDKRRRDREVLAYEMLFEDERLPVPRFYGWEWDAENQRRELYLEYVDDWSLRYQSLDDWLEAARELARLHRWFAERRDRLRPLDFLLSIDEGYIKAWAGRAVDAAWSLSSRLGARLQDAVGGLGPAAALLAQVPPTLVHNDLSPKNVIADHSTSPVRICFVDWELAGFGCGALDLVHLRYGLEPADANGMWSAYRAELAGTDVVPDEAEEDALLAACEVHKTLYRLAHARQWALPLSTVEEWIAETERLLSALPRRRRRFIGARA